MVQKVVTAFGLGWSIKDNQSLLSMWKPQEKHLHFSGDSFAQNIRSKYFAMLPHLTHIPFVSVFSIIIYWHVRNASRNIKTNRKTKKDKPLRTQNNQMKCVKFAVQLPVPWEWFHLIALTIGAHTLGHMNRDLVMCNAKLNKDQH